jgi:hypothetical protein
VPEEEPAQPAAIRITHLTHDLVKKQSIVTLIWEDGSERRLGLTVPFGTALDDIEQVAIQAILKLSAELSSIAITV